MKSAIKSVLFQLQEGLINEQEALDGLVWHFDQKEKKIQDTLNWAKSELSSETNPKMDKRKDLGKIYLLKELIKKTVMNYTSIAQNIEADIENGIYDRWPKIKSRMQFIAGKLVKAAYMVNVEMSEGELQTLKEEDYIR